MSPKLKSLAALAAPIVLAIVLSYFLQYKVLTNQEEVTRWLSEFGPFVILIYVILQALTIVIAPIGGFFLVVAMMTLYGEGKALIMAYLVVVPAFQLNFFLARRYGRPVVSKLVGKDSLEKVDHLVQDAGIWLLITSRILQASNFDYLAYAWGLTKIPTKTFTIVNILAGIPGMFITYLIFRSFDSIIFGLLTFYAVTTALAGIMIYLTHYLKKHKKF